jgi:outer membrane receptor protein involved in Fe transport
VKPEKADTFTAGIVLQPTGALSGFRASVDYYNIRVKGAIARLNSAQTQNVCAGIIAGGGTTCPGVTFTNTGNGLAFLSNQSNNLNKLVVSGVDIELGYRLGSMKFIPGSLDFTATINRAFHDQQYLPTGTFELANSSQGVPMWSGALNVTWNKGNFGGSWQMTGFTGVMFDTSTLFAVSTAAANPQTYTAYGTVGPTSPLYLTTNANSVNVDHFGGMAYSNVSARYNVGEHVELFGVVNNLFDRQPPEFAAVGVTNGGRNINYDILGRSYRAGVRVRY